MTPPAPKGPTTGSTEPVDVVFAIPEVDTLLSGQLPKGWLGILSGEPGSGVELVAKQFAQAANPRTPVSFYTTSERTDEVRRAMRDFSWRDDIRIVNLSDDYYDHVLSKDLEVSRFREKGISPQDLAQFRLEAVEPPPVNFITKMLVDLASFDKPFRLVIDSLDFFLEMDAPAAVIALVRQIRYRSQRIGGFSLLTLHEGIHEPRTVGILEDVADLLLDVERTQEHTQFKQSLKIRKVRNHPERTGSVPISIGPKGITSSVT
jgi:KaiC/GvpD/RAD55 family RecA-like ATPase